MRIAVGLSMLALVLAGGAAAQEAGRGVSLDVDELILDNGMRVLTVERTGVPRVFCALYWKVGSVNERPGITGLSHFFEHMMFKGTDVIGTTDAKRDRELNAKIEDVMGRIRRLKLAGLEAMRRGEPVTLTKGSAKATIREADQAEFGKLLAEYDATIAEQKKISIGEDLSKRFSQNGAFGNASTFYDWTRYFQELPANKVELFFWLESDRFLNPVFREFYPEREVVKEERRMRTESTPTGLIMEAFLSQFWQAHPYNWPVIGWMSDIDQYTYADAQEYFDTHYTPDNCTAIFVGDVKKAQIREMAKRYFGRIPRREVKRDAIVTLEPAQVAERRMVAEAESQPSLQIWWHGPSQAHADAPALDLLSIVLSGRTGRMHKHLVEGKKLALSAGASYWGMKYGGALELMCQPKEGADLAQIEKAFDEVVASVQAEPVTDRELQKARNQMLANLVRELDTNEGIGHALGHAEILSSWRDLMKTVPDTEKVTPKDIQRAAQKYFTPTGKNVLIINRKGAAGPKKDGGR